MEDRAAKFRRHIDRDGEMIETKGMRRDHPCLKHELAARAFVTRTIANLFPPPTDEKPHVTDLLRGIMAKRVHVEITPELVELFKTAQAAWEATRRHEIYGEPPLTTEEFIKARYTILAFDRAVGTRP